MFEAVSASDLVVKAIGVIVLFFAFDLWWRMAEAARAAGADGQRMALGGGAVLAVWVSLALLATLSSTLNEASRSIAVLPAALALGCIVVLLLLGLAPGFRRGFDAIPVPAVLAFSYWRAIFGGLLLAAYAAGRLAPGFGIPAGLGDLAVGMLGILLLALNAWRGGLPRGAVWLWNTAGLLDLAYALVLAATVLRPWAAQRGLPTNFAMQSFVIPVFVAIHLHVFGRLWRESRSAPAV